MAARGREEARSEATASSSHHSGYGEDKDKNEDISCISVCCGCCAVFSSKKTGRFALTTVKGCSSETSDPSPVVEYEKRMEKGYSGGC
jgi:hypothetical protein